MPPFIDYTVTFTEEVLALGCVAVTVNSVPDLARTNHSTCLYSNGSNPANSGLAMPLRISSAPETVNYRGYRA